jgi:hypothetical protein
MLILDDKGPMPVAMWGPSSPAFVRRYWRVAAYAGDTALRTTMRHWANVWLHRDFAQFMAPGCENIVFYDGAWWLSWDGLPRRRIG